MILDLFAGPGGWDQGMKDIGITDVLGIEMEKSAVDTAIAAGHSRRLDDVSLINPSEYSGVTGIVASPPCQGFSLAGKKLGRTDALAILDNLYIDKSELIDPRSHLVLEPLRYIRAIRPQWAAFEQVAMVLPLWEAIADTLRSEGYNVWTGIISAEEYGVPQVRRRAYLLAHRDKTVGPPPPTHSKFNPWHPAKMTGPQWITMAEALGWTNKEEWIKDNEDRFIGVPSDWMFKRPSPTIVGSFRPDIVAAPGYRRTADGPRQSASGSVKIDVQEAAILQSFPADYPWQGLRYKQFRQVGDAVPPKVAGAVIRSFLG